MNTNNIKTIWMDGSFMDWDKAQVHVLTHALHYGSSVFEGIRFYKTNQGPKIFRLPEHIKRFFYSAKILGLPIPYTKKTLCDISKKLIAVNKMNEGYLRPLAFFGAENLGIKPSGLKTHTALIVCPWPKRKTALSVCLSPYIRIHPQSTVVHAKIGGHYINSILALNYAGKKNYDEVIFLDDKGFVAEGAVANVFMIKNGIISTPANRSILPGITRDSVIEILRRNFRKNVLERNITIKELQSADEVFFVGTAYEITPILKINRKNIGTGITGPLSDKLKNIYQEIVHGKIPKYKKWLT